MTNELNLNSQPNLDDGQNGEWIQLNVGLVRHQGDALASARVLFRRINPLVNRWRSRSLLRWFFFMRKPPDVRLRFFTQLNPQQAIAQISDLMSALQQENYINIFFFSEYQPETERFGGTQAMQLVHQYFDLDTCLWLILDDLYQHHLSVISKDVLVPTVIHDLFQRIMPNQVSILTAWYCLAELFPTHSETVIPKIKLFSLEYLCQTESITNQEKEILQRYESANSFLAQNFISLHTMGQLTQDLPEILAALAMFTFHRHGFDWQRSIKLISAIIRTLEG